LLRRVGGAKQYKTWLELVMRLNTSRASAAALGLLVFFSPIAAIAELQTAAGRNGLLGA
jgi:hypothetical protein